MKGWARSLLLPALLGALLGGVLLLVKDQLGTQSQDGYADAVIHAAPSVVSIYSTRRMQPPCASCLVTAPGVKSWRTVVLPGSTALWVQA